ncbi:MAG: DUF4832 domain-containing protein [Pirellulaceae bacterium]
MTLERPDKIAVPSWLDSMGIGNLGPICFLIACAIQGLWARHAMAQTPPKSFGTMQTYELESADSPVDNPLKGLVPYADPIPERFPHSMEFGYQALSELMIGENQFNWRPLEESLNAIASRGNQMVLRIFVEYPGRKEGIPQFLIDAGLKVHVYMNSNTAPFPPSESRTPDYGDPRLRKALQNFIRAFGNKYDGDPRLAYITAGLLGTWGEWHTYPRNELWASHEVQAEVLDAYERHFKKTPVLLRYPAGKDHYAQAENASRSLGYHDDSFAWATIETGRDEDDWFFMPAMKAAGQAAMEKWRTQPIGGEIRPEVWGKIFDQKSAWPKQAQNFHECVSQTHATWLLDTGMFREQASKSRMQRALKEVGRMGYDFHISRCAFAVSQTNKQLWIGVDINNRGVAPFYADWPTEVAFMNEDDELQGAQTVAALKLQGILPTTMPLSKTATLDISKLSSGSHRVLMRVVHPLTNGKPLRFANQQQDEDLSGWLTLGTIAIP